MSSHFDSFSDEVKQLLPVNGNVLPPRRIAKAAMDFGEDNTTFLWYPYVPIGDYTVLMGPGGTGKTFVTSWIAARTTTDKPFPNEEFGGEGQNVVLISGEDSGALLKRRLALSGADLSKVFILDRSDSVGMNFAEGFEEFENTVRAYNPALVVIDPWHNFLGEKVDMSRANAVRPVFQRIAIMAKRVDCAVILVSHVNKRAQGENANNAAIGSADFINAARSALSIIFDEDDENCRIVVHTKANYSPYGSSVRFRIVGGGMEFDGLSDIDRRTLEAAARKKTTPQEALQRTEEREQASVELIKALKEAAASGVSVRFTYDDFRKKYGETIFGGSQPKRALDAVRDRLNDDGYFLKSGIVVRRGKTTGNGFLIQKVDTSLGSQTELP